MRGDKWPGIRSTISAGAATFRVEDDLLPFLQAVGHFEEFGRGIADPRDVSHGPGIVHLLLVPAMMVAEGPLEPEQLELPARVRREVAAYLDERRLLTSELVLDTPRYTWISVSARLRARPAADRSRVEREASEALYRYLHPAIGGPSGDGWPFGRELFAGELYSQLQQVAGVDVVEQVVLHVVDPSTSEMGPPQTEVLLEANGLLCSWRHDVVIQIPTSRRGSR